MESVRMVLQDDKAVDLYEMGADLFWIVCDCDATETMGLKSVLRVNSSH